jgi:hypothetical protein
LELRSLVNAITCLILDVPAKYELDPRHYSRLEISIPICAQRHKIPKTATAQYNIEKFFMPRLCFSTTAGE